MTQTKFGRIASMTATERNGLYFGIAHHAAPDTVVDTLVAAAYAGMFAYGAEHGRFAGPLGLPCAG